MPVETSDVLPSASEIRTMHWYSSDWNTVPDEYKQGWEDFVWNLYASTLTYIPVEPQNTYDISKPIKKESDMLLMTDIIRSTHVSSNRWNKLSREERQEWADLGYSIYSATEVDNVKPSLVWDKICRGMCEKVGGLDIYRILPVASLFISVVNMNRNPAERIDILSVRRWTEEDDIDKILATVSPECGELNPKKYPPELFLMQASALGGEGSRLNKNVQASTEAEMEPKEATNIAPMTEMPVPRLSLVAQFKALSEKDIEKDTT